VTEHLLPLAAGLAALLVAATLVWLLSVRLADTSVVDIFWGPFFLLQAIVYALVTPHGGFIGREVLLLVLVAVWSTRLATHIAVRNAGAPEDHRYTVMRRKVGAAWWWQSLPRVFVLQALLAWVIGVPLYAVMSGGPQGWSWLDAAALLVWGIGFTFEALGDVQLTAFIRNPANRGHTMQSGLWSLTRHPNYFGDATQWWAYWLLAVAAGGWWSIFGPIAMTFLIVRISGVGMLERTIAQRREGYEAYMRRTSAFIPWFPRDR
jgi:steroid 5-alpha reductase family enzyme